MSTKIKKTARVRRGLSALVPLAEGYLYDEASNGLKAAERKDIELALAWIRQECDRNIPDEDQLK